MDWYKTRDGERFDRLPSETSEQFIDRVFKKLESENCELKEEVRKFRMALESLTPQGSEFYNDADYCVKWIKRQKEGNVDLIKKKVVENRELRERLADIIHVANATLIGRRDYPVALRDILTIAQEGNDDAIKVSRANETSFTTTL